MNVLRQLLLANEVKYTMFFGLPCESEFDRGTFVQTIKVREPFFTWEFQVDISGDYECLSGVKEYIDKENARRGL